MSSAASTDPDMAGEPMSALEEEQLKQAKMETQIKARKLQIMQGTKTLVDQANAITKNRR